MTNLPKVTLYRVPRPNWNKMDTSFCNLMHVKPAGVKTQSTPCPGLPIITTKLKSVRLLKGSQQHSVGPSTGNEKSVVPTRAAVYRAAKMLYRSGRRTSGDNEVQLCIHSSNRERKQKGSKKSCSFTVDARSKSPTWFHQCLREKMDRAKQGRRQWVKVTWHKDTYMTRRENRRIGKAN